jgi:hypothetical protein
MQEFSAQVGEPITIERQCGTSGSTLVAEMQIKETTDTGPLELSKQASPRLDAEKISTR